MLTGIAAAPEEPTIRLLLGHVYDGTGAHAACGDRVRRGGSADGATELRPPRVSRLTQAIGLERRSTSRGRRDRFGDAGGSLTNGSLGFSCFSVSLL